MTKAEREAYLNRVARRTLTLMKKRATVRVFCTRDSDMSLLAARYLRKKKPLVDVLAFPEGLFPHPDEPGLLGEVYVNDDVFRRDIPHMRFLTVHGVLHLLGYDHKSKRDTIIMQELEQRLCQRIALPGSTSARQK